MIAAQAFIDQIHAAKETLAQKQLAVLTPEQKTTFDAFNAARGEGEKMMPRRVGPGGGGAAGFTSTA